MHGTIRSPSRRRAFDHVWRDPVGGDLKDVADTKSETRTAESIPIPRPSLPRIVHTVRKPSTQAKRVVRENPTPVIASVVPPTAGPRGGDMWSLPIGMNAYGIPPSHTSCSSKASLTVTV